MKPFKSHPQSPQTGQNTPNPVFCPSWPPRQISNRVGPFAGHRVATDRRAPLLHRVHGLRETRYLHRRLLPGAAPPPHAWPPTPVGRVGYGYPQSLSLCPRLLRRRVQPIASFLHGPMLSWKCKLSCSSRSIHHLCVPSSALQEGRASQLRSIPSTETLRSLQFSVGTLECPEFGRK